MEPVVGIYPSRAAAERAASDIRRQGLGDRVELLLPGTQALDATLPTDEAEQPGMGQAVGGVVGAATGASAGFGLGAVTASLLIPGVGAVTVIGLAAAALLGVIGAAGGVAAGKELEKESRTGMPKDEAFLYEDALSRGKGVLFARVDSEEEEKLARQLLEDSGAESLDAAREKWWVGVRDPREEPDAVESAESAEPGAYRRGFLAALRPEMEGRPFEEVQALLQKRVGELALSDSFRLGYARGRVTGVAELAGSGKKS